MPTMSGATSEWYLFGPTLPSAALGAGGRRRMRTRDSPIQFLECASSKLARMFSSVEALATFKLGEDLTHSFRSCLRPFRRL
jgi:hypothetical protein